MATLGGISATVKSPPCSLSDVQVSPSRWHVMSTIPLFPGGARKCGAIVRGREKKNKARHFILGVDFINGLISPFRQDCTCSVRVQFRFKYLQIILAACLNLRGVADRWDLPQRENSNGDMRCVRLVSNTFPATASTRWHLLRRPNRHAERFSECSLTETCRFYMQQPDRLRASPRRSR